MFGNIIAEHGNTIAPSQPLVVHEPNMTQQYRATWRIICDDEVSIVIVIGDLSKILDTTFEMGYGPFELRAIKSAERKQ